MSKHTGYIAVFNHLNNCVKVVKNVNKDEYWLSEVDEYWQTSDKTGLMGNSYRKSVIQENVHNELKSKLNRIYDDYLLNITVKKYKY